MNTKTTLFLAVVLVVLGSVYFVEKSRPVSGELETPSAPGLAATAMARDLSEDKLGDVVRVVCKRKGKEEWVFEKSKTDQKPPQDEWRMTAPFSAKCVKWEVDRFDRRLSDLKYEISYTLDQPGAPTLKEAGLDPPQAVVTLTDTDGKSIGIEIGRAPSKSETYVRKVGSDEIVLAMSNLKDLFKDSALAYRDKLLWNFDAAKVTHVDIEDRGTGGKPVKYALAKNGSRWMMESPVTARATGKVDDMLRAMANLRVTEWQDNDAAKLAMYGLEPGALSVRVTVEEQVPVAKPEAESAEGDTDDEETKTEPATETKTTSYELLFSDRSPIGEDTKTFLRVGGDDAVATVMRTVADKFRPVMSEWRDMHLTPANLAAATRVEIRTPAHAATLVKDGGDWSFDSDGGRAESSVVSELLSAAANLSAVKFIEGRSTDAETYGFDHPRAELRLTVPGVEGIERFTIGAYTDASTKRLIYVRRNDGPAVAKVRVADVSKLIREPLTYRDRTIIDVLPSRFERITLSSEFGFGGGRTELTLERSGTDWTITAPLEAPVRAAEVDKLMAQLGGLHAEAVVADDSQLSAYGLHAPAARISLTYKVVGETGDATDGEAASRTVSLAVAPHDGKYYAHVSGRSVIYEIHKDAYTQFTAEYRSDRAVEFDSTKVERFSIRHASKAGGAGGSTYTFVKRDDGWILEAEPDLPLDADKVKNLLLQIADLHTPRYVKYTGADPTTFGLDDPAEEVTVSLDDGSNRVLLVSRRQGGGTNERGYFSGIKDRTDVFLLTEDSVKRFEVSLDDLEAKE